MTKKVIPVIAIVIVLIIGFVAFRGKGSPESMKNKSTAVSSDINIVTVRVMQADTVSVTPSMQFKASLEASEEAIVSSKVAGKVVQVLFENGQYISQGEPLVKLDDQDIRNSLRSSEAQLNAAESQLKSVENQLAVSQNSLEKIQTNMDNANRSYERIKALFEQGGSSRVDMDNAELALKNVKSDYQSAISSVDSSRIGIETAKANIRIYQVAVENLRDTLANTTINAPMDGLMDEKNVSLGQFVGTDKVLGKVKKISPINAVIEVDQNSAKNIKAGDKVQVGIGNGSTVVYDGVVKSMDVSANISSRTFKCKLQIDNADQSLKPGIYAVVEIPSGQKREMITLPMQAFTGNEGGYSVFINDNGVARKRTVTIGEIIKSMIEVKSGVQKGESVIYSNVNMLQDGDAVKTVSE